MKKLFLILLIASFILPSCQKDNGCYKLILSYPDGKPYQKTYYCGKLPALFTDSVGNVVYYSFQTTP